MEKKSKFEAFVSDAGKAAKDLLGHAVQIADQNDDGKFDLQDVSAISESMGNAVKKGAVAVKERADEMARAHDLKTLRPIFSATLDETEFLMSKLIRIVERSKKYIESEACQASIGYEDDQKGLHIVHIFRDSVNAFGLTFYPDCDGEFYYVDPSDRDRYIALDDYFNHLKIMRITELQKIAQDLGAKHFKITYKEEQTSFSSKQAKASAKAGASAVGEHSATVTKYSTIETAAEMTFPGHAPIEPQLKYMQRDPVVQNLVSMRMDESAPLLHQTFMLKMSNSSGIKEADAVKIDAVLKGLKCSGNAAVVSEAKNEARRYLEYDITF